MRGFEIKKLSVWVNLCLLCILGCTLEVNSQTTAAVPTTSMPFNETCIPNCICTPNVNPTTVDCSGKNFTGVPVSELLILAEVNNVRVAHLDLSNNDITRISRKDFLPVNGTLMTVDLRNNKIRTIEDETFARSNNQYERLQTVHLAFNQLESLPDNVFLNLNLHTLDLSFNRLHSVPRALGRTNDMNTLRLNNNPIRELANDSFVGHSRSNGLGKLAFLDLSACQLSSFESCHLNIDGIFKSLAELYLDQNNFTTIKKTFFRCMPRTFGRLLSIRRSGIRTIEEKSFSKFIQLNSLSLEGNNLGLFKSQVFKGLFIFELDLSNCSITEFKRTIFKDTYISKTLHMSGNNLGVIHENDFKFLTGVHTLDLSHSNIHTIRESPFENLTNLGVLSLAGNQLGDEFLEKGLSGLTSVYDLDLSDNKLTRFPNLSGTLFPKLTELFLGGNKIHSLYRDNLQNMSSLKELIIKDNVISHIDDDVFAETPNITNLDMDNILVTFLPNMSYLPKLLTLQVIDGRLQYLPDDLCETCKRLAILEVKNNNLTTLPSFGGGCKLKVLGASNNNIRTLTNDTLSSQTILHLLDLDGNQIESIPDGFFYDTTYLEYLYLSSNKIKSFSRNTFARMPYLIYLDASSNKLTELEDHLFHNQLHTLQWLNLAHNYLESFGERVLPVNSTLVHLNLSGNNLNSVNFPPGGLVYLAFLYLEDNFELLQVPDAFESPRVIDVRYTHAYHCCIWNIYQRPHPFVDHDLNNTDIDPTTIPTPTSFLPPVPDCENGEITEKEREIHKIIEEFFVNLTVEYLPDCKVQIITNEGSDLGTSEEEPFKDSVTNHRTGARIRVSYTQTLMCSPRPDSLSPCDNLMDPWILRVVVWAVWVLSLLGNGTVLFVAIAAREKLEVYQFLICCLAFADFCTGVYLAFLAAVDIRTFGEVSFYQSALQWQNGAGCQAAGFIAVFASELSVFILIVLTLERVHTIAYTFHQNEKVKMRIAIVAAAVSVVVAAGLATMPLVGINSYSRVGVCLPYLTERPTDRMYIGLLLTINCVAFLVILFSYLYIFKNICKSPAANQKRKEISIAAAKIALLIVTAFCCWIPIAVIGYLALGGIDAVDTTQAKFLIVFVYPLNACLNPFIYAIFTRQFRDKMSTIFKRSSNRVNSLPGRRVRLTRGSSAYLPEHIGRSGSFRGTPSQMEMRKMRQSRRSNSLSVQLVTTNNNPPQVQTPPVVSPPPGAYMGRRASLPATFGSTLRSLQTLHTDSPLTANNSSTGIDSLPFRFAPSFHTGENSSQPDLQHPDSDLCHVTSNLDSPLTGSQESSNRQLPDIPEEQEENASVCSSGSEGYCDANEDLGRESDIEIDCEPQSNGCGENCELDVVIDPDSELSAGPSVSSLCRATSENSDRVYSQPKKYKVSSDSACSDCNSITPQIYNNRLFNRDGRNSTVSPTRSLSFVRDNDSFSSYDPSESPHNLVSEVDHPRHQSPAELCTCARESTPTPLNNNGMHKQTRYVYRTRHNETSIDYPNVLGVTDNTTPTNVFVNSNQPTISAASITEPLSLPNVTLVTSVPVKESSPSRKSDSYSNSLLSIVGSETSI